MYDLQPYPAYKDSGVPWLDMLPEAWEAGKLRRRLRTPDGVKIGPFGSQLKLEFMTSSGYKVFGQEHVIANDFTRGAKFVNEEKYHELAACAVQPGDLLLTMMGSSGRCAVVPRTANAGIMDSHLLRLRPNHEYLNSRYAALVLGRAPYVRVQIDAAGKGSIMHGLNSSIVKNLVIALPPLPDQGAIIRFLDHADRRIRRYILAKQKLIKLLEEQKQAIIAQAVTRGIEANVRLKPSGVEWLGHVPEHWEIRRIKACLTETRAGVWGEDPTPSNVSDQVVCMRVADFDMQRFRVSPNKLTVRAVPESARSPRLLIPGDILMEKSGGGDAEPVGRVVLYDGKVASQAITSNFIVRLRPNISLVLPEFLLFVMAIMQYTRRNIPCIKQTTGIQNLDEGAYLALKIGIPPLSEQSSILTQLSSALYTLQQSLEKCRREIRLLREYRTRLIADVVTGKLDVREAAAGLRDEAEDSEELLDDGALVGDDDTGMASDEPPEVEIVG